MLTRSLPMLLGLLTCSYLSFAAAYTPGHGHGHGGGHGHSIGHHSTHYRAAWTFHEHYHPVYHHRSGDHYYSSNTANYYNHSPVYINPLRGEHEVTIGAGLLPLNQMQDFAVKTASPSCFLTYKYYVSNGVAIGLTAGIQSMQGSSIYDNNGSQRMPFNYTQENTTVAAEVTWLYCSRGIFQAYGSLGLGLLHWTEYDVDRDNTTYTESGDKFAFQVTPLGFRVGRSLGAFAELGVGYKGLVFGGISYQAGWKKTHPFYNTQSY